MTTASQLSIGSVIVIDEECFYVESIGKDNFKNGTTIQTQLRKLNSEDVICKKFKPSDNVAVTTLEEKQLEFFYFENGNYVFLDLDSLDQVKIPESLVGAKADYLKSGIEVAANFYDDKVCSFELPNFLELMVTEIKIKESEKLGGIVESSKIAVLETDAEIAVPHFIEIGDVIKVNVKTNEFVQRI